MTRIKQQKHPSSRGSGKKASKSVGAAKAERKPHRWRPGTVALRQIRQLQKGGELLTAKKPFQRLVREIAGEVRADMRFERTALLALQEAAEQHLTALFENAQRLAVHGKRITVRPEDMQLVRHINGDEQQLTSIDLQSLFKGQASSEPNETTAAAEAAAATAHVYD